MWTHASASRPLVTLERKADQVTFAAGKIHDQSDNHWKRLSKTPFSPQPLKGVATELKRHTNTIKSAGVYVVFRPLQRIAEESLAEIRKWRRHSPHSESLQQPFSSSSSPSKL
jgi:hypothetical protein